MTTFVTAIFKLNDSNIKDERKTIQKRIEYFEEMVKCGIHISVICCPYYEPLLYSLIQTYDNVKVIKVMELSDTTIHKLCDGYKHKYGEINLPSVRDESKDNEEYMILMNSKPEFIKTAIEKNVWNTKYFCWIDFSIKYIVSNEELFRKNIYNISNYQMPLYQDNRMNIIIPGCSEQKNMFYMDTIDWRFCGGIIYGYKDDLIDLYDMNLFYFKQFLYQYKTLVWEVNIWAWLEFIEVFHPYWTYGDHNDTMFMLLK